MSVIESLTGTLRAQVAIVLSGTNIVGYSKGSKDAKQRLTDMASQSMVNSMFSGSGLGSWGQA
eukprot:1915052-Pyramimonas_sp.AAC.1